MKKIVTLLIIVFCISLMFPILSFGAKAEFYCTTCGDSRCGKSLGGIFHAMKTHKAKWLSTTPVKGKNFGNERSPKEARDGENATIYAIGALCFGHATSDNKNTSSVVGAVIDTSATKGTYKEHLLAYWVHQSWVYKEKGSAPNSKVKAKQRIRKWAHANYKSYGGVIQDKFTNGKDEPEDKVEDYNTTAAIKYANAVVNGKFTTSSKKTGSQKIEKIGDYTYIGPYNFNFSGGKITKCVLKKRDGKDLDITLYSTNKSKREKLEDLESYEGSSFYLVYKGTVPSVEKITITKTIDVINSRTVLSHSGEDEGQNVAIFYGEKTTKDISFDFPEVSYSSLEITKIDKDTKEKLSGIEFIIKHGDKYVKSGSPATYVTKANAEVFTTGSDGKIKISNLPNGGDYTIYEVKNPYYQYEKVSKDDPKNVGTVNVPQGQDCTYTAENDQIVAHIKITKIDAKTEKKLSDIGFIVYLEGKGYVKENKNALATYVSDKKNATIYYTGSNGTVTVKDLPNKGKYTVYEVENPYYQYDEVTLEKPLKVGTKQVNDFTTFEMTAENEPIPLSELTIIKKDKDSGELMDGVGFVVKCPNRGGYLIDAVPVEYTTNINKATVYTTGKDGKVTVKSIRYTDKYEIYEVANENFGYEEVSKAKPKKMSTVDITRGKNTTVTEKNKRLYIKLSGYVWEDIATSKASSPNEIYQKNDKDKKLGNVTVRLKDKNGKTIATKTTNSKDGSYIFGNYDTDKQAPKIEIEKLKDMYIEFEYNGMCYKSVAVKSNEDNGSKASDETENGKNDRSRDEFDAEFATITKGKAQKGNHSLTYNFADHKATLQYGGTYKYGYNGQKYPISGINAKYLMTADTYTASPNKLLGQSITKDNIYKQGLTEIGNINLGVVEREMPDVSVVQDVMKAEVSVNGYHHTYEYADRFSELTEQENAFKKQYAQTGEIFDVGVNFAQKYNPGSYTRAIYSADIVYNENETEADKKLKVYITYRVKLTNESGSVNTKVNEIYNYYDKDYIIHELKELDKNGKVKRDLGKGTSTSYNSEYNKVTITPAGGIELPHNECKYIEITYEFNNSSIVKILNKEQTLNSITEVASYSSFEGDFKNPYAGIDRDSAPNNSTIGDQKTYDDDIDQAPSMTLKVNPGRMIQGTVWEENAIQELLQKEGIEKQRMGDGKYSKEVEKVIKGVQVDLGRIKDDGTFEILKLYQYDKLTRQIIGAVPATVQTNNKGEYILDGVIPDKYVIRFTYKNSSVICNVDGSEKGTIEALEEGVHNYKSTLYRTERKANGQLDTSATSTSDGRWYVKETKGTKRLSDAKDDDKIIEERTTKNEEIIKNSNANGTDRITEIPAYTSQLEITLEWEEGDLDNISDGTAEFKYEVSNIDFGIIRRPKQDIRVDKQISYIEIVLANGQSIVKGDPRLGTLQHVKYMPDGNVHVELDSEIIQGANLKVTYEIIVNNKNCETDYNFKDYYIYGKIPTQSGLERVAKVVDLFDYPKGLDINFEEQKKDASGESVWKYVENLDDLVTVGRLSDDARDGLKEYNYILQTQYFKDMPANSEVKLELKLRKLLATTDNDLLFDNDIEINTYYYAKIDDTIPGNYNPVTGSPDEADDDHVSFVITGPTGQDKQYIPYIIIGVTSFVLLAIGIVIVKRKVIK